jgi:hypothetical protein
VLDDVWKLGMLVVPEGQRHIDQEDLFLLVTSYEEAFA